MITKFKLFESPDVIKLSIDGEVINVAQYWDDDCYAFGIPKFDMVDYEENNLYREGELWLSEPMGNHEEVYYSWDNLDYKQGEYNKKHTDRKNFKFAGRIWLKKKIISFWFFPEKDEMMDFIKELEYKINTDTDNRIDIIPDEWKIEIEDDETYPYSKLIKLSDYIGSNERSEEEINMQHTESPLNKKDIKVRFPGWKPKKLKGQLPGESEVAARFRMFQEQISRQSY